MFFSRREGQKSPYGGSMVEAAVRIIEKKEAAVRRSGKANPTGKETRNEIEGKEKKGNSKAGLFFLAGMLLGAAIPLLCMLLF